MAELTLAPHLSSLVPHPSLHPSSLAPHPSLLNPHLSSLTRIRTRTLAHHPPPSTLHPPPFTLHPPPSQDTGVVASIFSSASVNAQKLLFQHSSEGDLCPLLSHHFDKETGSKKKMQSYIKICQELNIRPG